MIILHFNCKSPSLVRAGPIYYLFVNLEDDYEPQVGYFNPLSRLMHFRTSRSDFITLRSNIQACMIQDDYEDPKVDV